MANLTSKVEESINKISTTHDDLIDKVENYLGSGVTALAQQIKEAGDALKRDVAARESALLGTISRASDKPQPSVMFDFIEGVYLRGNRQPEKSETFDEALNFSRGSTATYWGSDKKLKTADPNEPRYDHDPETGKLRGLLMEGASTNLVEMSDPMHGSWGASRTDTTVESRKSFDGTTRDVMVFTPTDEKADHYLATGGWASVPGEEYTVSLWVAEDNAHEIGFIPKNWDGDDPARSGAMGPDDVVESANGWVRYAYTFTTPADCLYCTVRIYLMGEGYNYSGDGSSSCVDAVQVEEGITATSYIPTQGGIVTRAGDEAYTNTKESLSPSGFSLIVDSDGGYWAAGMFVALYNTKYRYFSLGYSSTIGGFLQPSTAAVEFNWGVMDVPFRAGVTMSIDGDSNASLRYVRNGVTRHTLETAYSKSDVSAFYSLSIGSRKGSGYSVTKMWFRRVVLYPEALSQTQIEDLTQ